MTGDPAGGPQPPLCLLEYPLQQDWKVVRGGGHDEVSGLGPLHRETRPFVLRQSGK